MDVKRKEIYLQELDEAIRQLNASYAEFENYEYLLNITSLSEAEKSYLRKLVSEVRIYETHAYIRLKTLEKDFKENIKKIEELRKKIKEKNKQETITTETNLFILPKLEDVYELVLEYNKIKAKDLEDDQFFERL